VTAPAPRVVYQRMLLDNVQCEAPDTTEPVLVDEPTPLDGCKLLDALDELEDDEDDALDVCERDDVVPGFVTALTAPNTPTPAIEARAAPIVIWFSNRSAASRTFTRRVMWSMTGKRKDWR